jgi:dsRNA-specific ribonuclease
MPDKNTPEFIKFIRKLLKTAGRLKTSQINIITSEEHHATWRTVFTTKYEDPVNNYELYELFGDESLDCAFLHYLRKRFPQLTRDGMLTATVARLKINYLDVETFSNFAIQYGLADWITLPDVSSMTDNERNKYLNKSGELGIYEDVLEAFYGATETLIDDYILDGLSTIVLRNMTAYMFENSTNVTFDLRYTTLFDPKTRLKQVMDFIYYRDFGASAPDKRRKAIWYETRDTDNGPCVTLSVAFPVDYGSDEINFYNKHVLAVVCTGERQKKIEKQAAEIGLHKLAASGYSFPDPPEINTNIERKFGYIGPNEKASYYITTDENITTIPNPSEMINRRRY